MRLSQTTAGAYPSWSQTAGIGQGVDWSSTLDRAVSDTPAWVLSVTAGAVVLALLGMTYVATRTAWRASERARTRLAEERQAAVEAGKEPDSGWAKLPKRLYAMALCSLSVSLYGMWGFARETAQLPEPFAVGFLAAFDLTELVLFTLLYKRADKGWTTQLRLMHNLAWCLVAVSATANFIHAPNASSAPFMAIMPVVAAVVIELEFRAVMKGAELPDTEDKPGPGKLIGLLWTKGWAALFAGLDIDPASKGGQVYRAALAKKAGKKLFRLRSMLETQAKHINEGRQAKRRRLAAEIKELQQARKAATTSMARADFAVDSNQALSVLRELGGWSEVDDVAVVDFKNPTEVTELMERVAIMPAAKRIEAAERAAELDESAKRAEEARAEAEDARERAEEEKRAAVEEKTAAETARQEAEEALARAAEETEAAKAEASRAADARQCAEAARERAESEMTEEAQNVARLAERAEEEQKKLSDAADELARLQGLVAEETERRTTAAGEVTAVRDELQRLVDERETAKDSTREHTEEARRAAGEVERLRSALVEAQDAVSEHTTAAEKAVDLRRQAEENQRLAAQAATRSRAEAREAAELLESLRPQLAERLGGVAEVAISEGPAFRSEAKQAGWEDYLTAAKAGRELPTANELAERYGVNDGNARNWLGEFKIKRAEMIATGDARQTRGTLAASEDSSAEPRAAREEPRGHRADDHGQADAAAQNRLINGQRQPA